MASAITTARLRLIPASSAMIAAELDSPEKLAQALGVEVPPDWPPEYHDAEVLRFWDEQLAQPGAAGWWLYYAVATQSATPTLVGSVGYKGPPADGVVEIGYSVVPSWRRRGLATEASQALIDAAWERGARMVIAHTLAHLEPSLGVLRKLGFEPAEPSGASASSEPSETSELEFRLQRG
jgi:RimJ/RimL family protein N-acetyltransferase